MERLFAIEGKFFRIMSTLADLMILNLMWIIASIPIITIGASTTALFSVTVEMVEKKESYIIKSFWKVFLRNLKSSTVLWMIFLTEQMILAAVIGTLSHVQGGVREPALILAWMCEIILLLIWIPVIPLRAARKDLTTAEVLRLAAFTAVAKLPWTVMLLVGTAVLTAVTLFYPLQVIPLWMFIGVAGNVWIISSVFHRTIIGAKA